MPGWQRGLRRSRTSGRLRAKREMKGSRWFFTMLSTRYSAGSLQEGAHCSTGQLLSQPALALGVAAGSKQRGRVAPAKQQAHRLYVLLDGCSHTGSCALVLSSEGGERVDLRLGVEGELAEAGDVALHKLPALGCFHSLKRVQGLQAQAMACKYACSQRTSRCPGAETVQDLHLASPACGVAEKQLGALQACSTGTAQCVRLRHGPA